MKQLPPATVQRHKGREILPRLPTALFYAVLALALVPQRPVTAQQIGVAPSATALRLEPSERIEYHDYGLGAYFRRFRCHVGLNIFLGVR